MDTSKDRNKNLISKNSSKRAVGANPDAQDNALSETLRWREFELDETAEDNKAGVELIADFVKRLPNSPGVYRMFNTAGDVLYVGKARSLKKRVASYTKMIGHTNRIARMIHETRSMEFVTTHTETEALLLEANLIKRLRPRYNVLLRDDKSFPYIVITDDYDTPGVFKHRGARRKDRNYYGPFASAGAVTRTINAMQKVFLIRTCTNGVFEGRSRPCLLHQIKRCSAPCTDEISSENYKTLVTQSKRFLSGKSNAIKDKLAEQMQQASGSLDFETAAIIRDRLTALSHIQSHQGINPQTVNEADLFAIEQKGGMNCIQVFFFRTGQNWGNHAYFPRADEALDAKSVLKSFLTQFYDNKPCPKMILISQDIEEMDLIGEALSVRAGHKVILTSPLRGEKRELVKQGLMNAREALGRKLAETSTQAKLLTGVGEAFGLEQTPKRIEVYDNSHISGTNAVGAMIVAGREGFAKNQYRKFNIKSKDLVPGDDYGMMREVMTRRFSRLLKEQGERPKSDENAELDDTASMAPWPDLVLIDGGLGQLNAVKDTLADLGLEGQIPLVGIAKGPERDAGLEKFFMPGKQSFMLPERDPVLYFVQRLRDEAHRFAIGSHRTRRKKEMIKNPLDEVAGIGPSRKRALLHHFGTAKAVSRAALSDLKAVEGISAHMAQSIYEFFHDNNQTI
ncbi:MAG: excinuclease ABC subunit UvrC [Hyphomicrobiales bacterium]|nr:excinuclease ABC subunit UvrC [Hyphomicrobiales bacterium]